MKKIFYFTLFILFISCNENKDRKEVFVDPLTKKFILSLKESSNQNRKNVFYFIYPSVCGACTDSVMNFIKEQPLPDFHSYYVVPSSDSLPYKLARDIKYIDPLLLGRYGLEAAANKMYVFVDTLCIYYTPLSFENITSVRKQVDSLGRKY